MKELDHVLDVLWQLLVFLWPVYPRPRTAYRERREERYFQRGKILLGLPGLDLHYWTVGQPFRIYLNRTSLCVEMGCLVLYLYEPEWNEIRL